MATFLQPHLHTYRILELTSEVSTFATWFLRYTSKHLGDHGGVNVSTVSFAHISTFGAHLRGVNICNVLFEIYLQTPGRSRRCQRIYPHLHTWLFRYTSKHLGDHGGVNVSTASFAHISKFWRSESSNSKLGHLDKEIISSKHLGDHGGVNVSTVSFAHISNF